MNKGKIEINDSCKTCTKHCAKGRKILAGKLTCETVVAWNVEISYVFIFLFTKNE